MDPFLGQQLAAHFVPSVSASGREDLRMRPPLNCEVGALEFSLVLRKNYPHSVSSSVFLTRSFLHVLHSVSHKS